MKKQFRKIFLGLIVTTLMVLFSFSASALLSSTDCIGESVEVSTFAELKSAMENYGTLANVVLKNNITVNDDTRDYTIAMTNSGAVTLDLNGYKLTVNSKATKYLFNITGQAYLYFVNSSSYRGAVTFNTTQPGAAAVRVYHSYAEVYNVNADFSMGTVYKSATDSSDTAVFRVDRATEMSFFGGILHNEMTGGCGVYVDPNSRNQQKLTLRVGGGEIEADKYCVEFDPDYVKSELFGSVRLESLNGNKSLYERIKVPSGRSLTLNDLWYLPTAGTTANITIGGSYVLNKSQKIADLSKGDIVVTRNCDALSNVDDFIVLRCAGGHMRLCGSCQMKFNYVDTHEFQKQIGVAATCTTNGKTTGNKCTECRYSTSKTIPKTGHNVTYVSGKPASCGVDGVKAHYYCADCRGYFSDAAGNNTISSSDVVIKNNHNIENKPAVSATCTKTGLTSGVYCHTCKKTILKQEVIPAKGHDYPSSWAIRLYPNCQYEGEKVKVCNRCGDMQRQTIAKTAHINANDDENCDFCGKKLTSSDPVQPDGPQLPGDEDAIKNCSCNCHAKGIKNFFFKIGLFFQRIFRLNKYCKGCGVAHY